MLTRLTRSFRHFDEIARAYYGKRPWCYPRYLYYALLRVNKFVVFRRDLNSGGTNPFAGMDFDIRVVPTEELAEIRKGVTLPKEFYCDISHGLTRCYVAFSRKEVAYIQWVVCHGERSRFFRLEESVAEFVYTTTLPRFRRMGLSKKGMEYICQTERARGVKTILTAVHSGNVVMIKCLEKTGFRQVGTIKTVGQLNRKMAVAETDA
jgi:ribosomal protein S18 acetylase RimI-like enzyme